MIRYDLNTAQCQVTEVLPAQSADSSSLPLSLNSETGVFAYRKAASQFWFLVNLQTSSEPKMLTLTVFSCSIVSNVLWCFWALLARRRKLRHKLGRGNNADIMLSAIQAFFFFFSFFFFLHHTLDLDHRKTGSRLKLSVKQIKIIFQQILKLYVIIGGKSKQGWLLAGIRTNFSFQYHWAEILHYACCSISAPTELHLTWKIQLFSFVAV